MNFVVEFYRSLDTLNLIIFWGVIIVVLLLLTFSIIIANKNKKLKQLLNMKKPNLSEKQVDTELFENNDVPIISSPVIIENETENEKTDNNIDMEIPIEEEKEFIAEEHVIEYNKDLFSIPNIEKVTDYHDEKTISNNYESKKEIEIPTKPYQRNVLREMSLSQTSPIGIVKKDNPIDKKITQAKELQQSLSNEREQIDDAMMDYYTNKITEDLASKKEEQIIKNNSQNNKEKYLLEVSKKLSEATDSDEIDRTEYELKQEEEAIISYEELMQKKDSIKMVDEEEAVISIEELMQKQKQNEKLYNLTEEEENDKFISELKNFRKEL